MWSFLRKASSSQTVPTAEIKRCSFCSKTQHDVRKLIAGPTVYICEDCIDLCNDILAGISRGPKIEPRPSARAGADRAASSLSSLQTAERCRGANLYSGPRDNLRRLYRCD